MEQVRVSTKPNGCVSVRHANVSGLRPQDLNDIAKMQINSVLNGKDFPIAREMSAREERKVMPNHLGRPLQGKTLKG